MNLVPVHKSIFAPSPEPKNNFLLSASLSKISFSVDKDHETSDSHLMKSPPFSPISMESCSPEPEPPTPIMADRLAFRRSNTNYRRNRPTTPSAKRSSLLQMDSFTSKNLYKKFATMVANNHRNMLKSKSSDEVPELSKLNSSLFKEYKYRTPTKNPLINGEENEMRIKERLSIFSAHGSGIIDTRPIDPPRPRRNKHLFTFANLNFAAANATVNATASPKVNSPVVKAASPIRASTRSSSINTPSYLDRKKTQGYFMRNNSESSEEDESLSTDRKRLRKKLKKGLYSAYFIGVMLTFKSKVKVFGAVRPIEYLENFESYKPPEKKLRLFPILPTSLFSVFWGLMIMLLLISSAILTPIYISFIDDDNQFFYYLNLVTDILFAIDIFVNFLSAYHDSSHQLVTNFKRIALNYLQMWFWIDMISIIPVNNIIQWITDTENTVPSASKIMKLLRFPRMYKLVKIIRLAKLAKFFSANHSFNQIQKALNLNTRITKLFRIFVNFAFLNHLVGCLWFYLARLDDFNPDTWVQRAELADQDVGTQYIASLYWSFQTLTTVGYGDIAPQTSLERSVAAIWTVIGVLIYSFTVGNLSTIFFSFGVQTESLKNSLISFERFARQVDLPDFLNQKVRRAFEINHKEKNCNWIDPNEHLKSLPASLKTSVLLFSYYEKVKHIKFLQIDPNLTASLLVHFKLLKLSKGEMIYREDDPPYEIYFIMRGVVKFITQKSKEIFSISEGTYFGEVEIFEKTKRKCFCKALEPAVLLACPKEAFLNSLKDFPEIQMQMEKMMELRRDKLKQRIQEIKTQEVLKFNRQRAKHRTMCKTTDYINKVLLKIPDFNTRFQIKRDKERSMLIQTRRLTFLTAPVRKQLRPSTLITFEQKKDSMTSLPMKSFQKSMIDISSSPLDGDDLEMKKDQAADLKLKRTLLKPFERKETIGFLKPLAQPEIVKKDEEKGQLFVRKETIGFLKPPAQPEIVKKDEEKGQLFLKIPVPTFSPRIKSLNASETGQNLLYKAEDFGTLFSEPKEGKFDTLFEQGYNESINSMLSLKTKTDSYKTGDNNYEARLVKTKTLSDHQHNQPRSRIQTLLKKPISLASQLFGSIKRKISKVLPAPKNKVAPFAGTKKSSVVYQNRNEKKMKINFFLAPPQ